MWSKKGLPISKTVGGVVDFSKSWRTKFIDTCSDRLANTKLTAII